MKAELIEPKSNNLKDLQNYIAELSSVVRDQSPKSAEKLFNRLLSESVGDKASRVLEYIPCIVDLDLYSQDIPSKWAGNHYDILQWFGFSDGEYYYTNARELLNWGWSIESVLKRVDFTHYKVFKCETPYFVYGQVSTHNQLTTVSHSQRYAECDRGYWMPPEVSEYLTQESWNVRVETFRPNELKTLMKKCGVTRKEVFDRGMDMLQNRVFVIGGYTNNPYAWGHFLEQRLDIHTQLETREFTMLLDEQLKPT